MTLTKTTAENPLARHNQALAMSLEQAKTNPAGALRAQFQILDALFRHGIGGNGRDIAAINLALRAQRQSCRVAALITQLINMGDKNS